MVCVCSVLLENGQTNDNVSSVIMWACLCAVITTEGSSVSRYHSATGAAALRQQTSSQLLVRSERDQERHLLLFLFPNMRWTLEDSR